jgi:murein DD-endopeptidase MepM/ murein hydrolase activator NlpD
MAGLRDTIKTTSSYFGLISNSLRSTRKSFSTTNNSINNIKKNITNNSKIKKDLFLNTQIIRKQREEASKRKEMEDLLESSKVSSSATNAVEFVEKSDSPPLTRLLNALGYVTAGWIIENIPTWVFVGKEFVNRINKVSMSVYNLTSDIFNISTSFNRLLQNSFISIVTFDFRQFTEGSVSDSFGELTKNLQDFGNKLSNAFSVFSVPLTQSLDGTQRAPGLGEPRTKTLIPDAPAPSGAGTNQTKASYGTKEQRAMLDAIAWAEGGVSYRTMFGGGQFDTSKGWKHPDTVVRKNGYASAAAGRYQFMPDTWNMASKALRLTDFSPINQDKAAIWLMDRKLNGDSSVILLKEGVSNRVLNSLSTEWAAVPMAGGGSYYGQPSRRVLDFKNKYNSFLKTSEEPSKPQSPSREQAQPSTPLAPTSSFTPVSGNSGSMGLGRVSLPYSPFKPNSGVVITSVMGLRWGREHNGWDIAGKEGTPMYAYLPGVVTHINKTDSYGAGYGWWVIWKDSVYGSYHFFGHMQKPSPLNVGDSVRQGTLMGYMGSSGRSTAPHLHWEISKYPPKENGRFTSYEDIGQWTRKNPLVSAPGPGPSPTQRPPAKPAPAQVSPTASPAAQAQLTPPPERAAADLMIFTPAQDSAPPTATTAAATQLAPPNTISDFRLLNNFIKNKLLLDLAYL